MRSSGSFQFPTSIYADLEGPRHPQTPAIGNQHTNPTVNLLVTATDATGGATERESAGIGFRKCFPPPEVGPESMLPSLP